MYSKSVDFWSYGVLLYTMIYGRLPDMTRESTKDSQADSFSEVLKESNTSPNPYQNQLNIADDLLSKLLQVDPEIRLGSDSGDVELIKQHKFFSGIDWDQCLSQELEPPFIPDLAHDHDTSYFDRKLTSLTLDIGI